TAEPDRGSAGGWEAGGQRGGGAGGDQAAGVGRPGAAGRGGAGRGGRVGGGGAGARAAMPVGVNGCGRATGGRATMRSSPVTPYRRPPSTVRATVSPAVPIGRHAPVV